MKKRPLRILVLSDAGSFHTERYVTELFRQGCEVLLASLENGKVPHYQLRRKGFVRAFWYVLAASEVRRLIRQFEPDIVNPHFVSGYGFTAALAQMRKRVPIVTHLWGSDILLVPGKSVFHARKTAYALGHADVILADSNYLLEEAEKIARLKASQVIPWGIEREYLSYHKNDYTLGRPLKIIVPRPHEKVYDNFFVVQALAPMINSGLMEVTFPSFGSLAGHFRLNAKPLVGDALRFYEPMVRSDYLRFVAKHDVYLSASMSDSSPVSLIEAMALGLIPIAANITGVREWLWHKTGYQYEPYNAAALQQIVGGLIQKPHDHAEMRRGNLELVKDKAVFEDNVTEMLGLMRELAEETAP